MGLMDSLLGQNDNQIKDSKWGGLGQGQLGSQYTDAQQQQANDAAMQQKGLALTLGAAQGNAPSAAAMQMQSGLEDSLRAQASAANSARGGPLALAAAQRQAANNAAQMQQANTFNTGLARAQEMAQARGQLGDQTSQARGQTLQGMLGVGGLSNQAASSQLGADVQTQQMREQQAEANAANAQAGTLGMVKAGLGAAGGLAMMSDERQKTDVAPIERPPATAGQALAGALFGAAGMDPTMAYRGRGGAYAKSDAESKRDVTPIDHMLGRVEPVSFNYKDPAADGAGRKYGVLAQDLERSPMGASLVHDTPRGKMVSVPDAAMANLAIAADHQRRLDEIERAMGKGRR